MGTVEEGEPLIPSLSKKFRYGTEFGTDQTLNMEPIYGSTSGDPETYSDTVVFSWHDINTWTTGKEKNLCRRFMPCLKSRTRKEQILSNVCGVAYPGELLVIMGSSGAGKTTLLNALTFRSGKNIINTGQIAINGQRIKAKILDQKAAYVQQTDLFIGSLTVHEHLLFHAMVRMNKNIDLTHRIERVDEVISELALSKCKDTVIGIPGRLKGLSGGEMKRLSLAAEVLTDPPLLFCDEPTSGLDSFMAHQIISILKSLSARGKTVVVTLHQPSSELFALFDKILLMAEGRVAFMGTTNEAIDFFKSLGAYCPSNYNPADYFIQILAVVPNYETSCQYAIESVCDAFSCSEFGRKMFEESAKMKQELNSSTIQYFNVAYRMPYKISWYKQFRAVFWRSCVSVMKEPILIKVRILQTIMVSLLIGIVYFGQQFNQEGIININGALFIFLTNMTFQNIFAVINVFCAELPIFLKENRNGMYRTDVYFICKTLAETPIFIAVPLVFTAITYPMIGLYPNIYQFFITVCIVALVANVATSFGYLVSCLSESISIALSIGPPVIIPFLLFGGFFLNTASVPSYFVWLSELSWFKYGNEALLITQWSNVDSIACDTNTTCISNGHMVLETLNFHEDHFYVDIISLIGLIIFFRFLAFLALIYRTYRDK